MQLEISKLVFKERKRKDEREKKGSYPSRKEKIAKERWLGGSEKSIIFVNECLAFQCERAGDGTLLIV